MRLLSATAPTLAMHAHLTKPFGKGNLINLLRQFSQLHMDKKQVSVGFIGYPNVGKSSVINALRSKKVCKTAPIPGETKVWQYITLFKRVYLIDWCVYVFDFPSAKEWAFVCFCVRESVSESLCLRLMRAVQPGCRAGHGRFRKRHCFESKYGCVCVVVDGGSHDPSTGLVLTSPSVDAFMLTISYCVQRSNTRDGSTGP